MMEWTYDLLGLIAADDKQDSGEHAMFTLIANAALQLGFDFCAYGRRVPLPVSNPRVQMVNNYPAAWQARYIEAHYLDVDPTVAHGRQTNVPVLWDDRIFVSAPELWHEAKSVGLRVGWAQSSLDGVGVGGMLTLVRSHEALTSSELSEKEVSMRWLVHIAHLVLTRALQPADSKVVGLTPREMEVLRWAADGKTYDEISDILTISVDTVKFHTRNAIAKLGSVNKTAATVKAAMLGLLN